MSCRQLGRGGTEPAAPAAPAPVPALLSVSSQHHHHPYYSYSSMFGITKDDLEFPYSGSDSKGTF
ncbi:hypothetical protein JYU34_007493 [Plutella xylostella]|uniref:Uncharacterized protein n=1 Tax=Plutella xylostella TaxID=51655 RepID=A0ABQ7QQK6_PLUXY|nr:hypothetical protein JYU34_007493 [Plutella xylostella]